MLKIFLTFLVIAGGITDATRNCSIGLPGACRNNEIIDVEFPETEEELFKLCNPVIDFLQCGITYEEHCHTVPDFIEAANYLLPILHEICSEDTLLHAAIVENLKCFKELIEEYDGECKFYIPSEKELEELAQSLLGERLNPDSIENTQFCLRELYSAVCEAVKIEKKCGTIAMDVFIELVRKIAIVEINACTEEIVDLFPTMVHIYKLQQEKEKDVEEVFKRKK